MAQLYTKDYLEHSGVKNQRWGNRRYQNKDGSLTPLGRQHYGVGPAREKPTNPLEQNINQGKGKPKISPAEKTTRETQRAIQESSSAVKNAAELKKQAYVEQHRDEIKKQTESLSDDELRRRINRMNLERQYASLTTPDVASGEEKTARILDMASSVAGIALSGVTIAAIMYNMKHGNNG